MLRSLPHGRTLLSRSASARACRRTRPVLDSAERCCAASRRTQLPALGGGPRVRLRGSFRWRRQGLSETVHSLLSGSADAIDMAFKHVFPQDSNRPSPLDGDRAGRLDGPYLTASITLML